MDIWIKFHIMATVGWAAIIMEIQTLLHMLILFSLVNSLEWMAMSYGTPVFRLLRTVHAVLHNCTGLHSCQHCVSVFAMYPHQYLLFLEFWMMTIWTVNLHCCFLCTCLIVSECEQVTSLLLAICISFVEKLLFSPLSCYLTGLLLLLVDFLRLLLHPVYQSFMKIMVYKHFPLFFHLLLYHFLLDVIPFVGFCFYFLESYPRSACLCQYLAIFPLFSFGNLMFSGVISSS